MPNNEDARRMRELAEQVINSQKLSAGTDKSGSAEELIYDSASIHPPTLKAAKALMELHERATRENDLTLIPEVAEVIDKRPELVMLIRLGDNVRFIRAVTELSVAKDQFFSNVDNHYNSPAVHRKFKKDADFQAYLKRYSFFSARVNVVINETRNRISAWATQTVDTTALSQGNELKKYRGLDLGTLLIKESADSATNNRPIRMRAYGDLCELILGIVEKDRQQTDVISKSKATSDEFFTKLLLELTAVRAVNVGSEFKDFHPDLLKICRVGAPLYNLFSAFMTEFPAALIEEDHPHHAISVELLTLINTFRFEAVNVPPGFESQPFNYQFFQGLAHKDFNDLFNYQEFLTNLSDLAKTDSPNQAWYQSLFEYALSVSHYFAHEVVYEATRAQEVIFASEQHSNTDIHLTQALNDIFERASAPYIDIIVDSQNQLVNELGFAQQDYAFHIEGRRVQRGVFVISAETLLFYQNGDESKSLRKFRYQVRVEHGQETVYFPVTDQEMITPYLVDIALEQVKRVMQSVYEEVLTERESKTNAFAQFTDVEPAHKKFGNRDQRIAAHQERVKDENTTQITNVTDEDIEIFHSSTAEVDAVSRFVPSKLSVLPALQQRMDKQGKKGSMSEVFETTSAFVSSYNAAEKNKPGRGIQMSDVFGPDGETVWRFRPTHSTRCIAVSISEGEAVIIDVDYRDSIYGSTKEMRQSVAKAIDKYFRTQRK